MVKELLEFLFLDFLLHKLSLSLQLSKNVTFDYLLNFKSISFLFYHYQSLNLSIFHSIYLSANLSINISIGQSIDPLSVAPDPGSGTGLVFAQILHRLINFLTFIGCFIYEGVRSKFRILSHQLILSVLVKITNN